MDTSARLAALTNEEILGCYQNAEPAAFDEFYRRTSDLVFNFLLFRVGNRQQAEDLLQETYLRIHRRILTYDPERNALSWVLTIAKNAAVDAYRKRSETLLPESPDGEVAASAEAALAARQSLERLLAELSPTERELLVKRFLEEQSYEELAESSGASEPSLRKRVSRLVARLRSTGA